MTGTFSVPNISTSLNYLTKRNKVMNYYSLLNHFFPLYGGRITNRGVSDGYIYIYNLKSPRYTDSKGDSYAMPRSYTDARYHRLNQDLDMNSKKITNLADQTDTTDGVNKKYIDDNYLKLSGDTMTGHIILNNAVLTSQYQAISRNTGNAFSVQITNPYVYHQFNMVKNKIINLGDQTDALDATDAVNKQYLEKSHVKPSHYKKEFKYLMTNILAWADLEPNNIDSFDITEIDNLMPQDSNYHQYNHKVLYTTIVKDKQGGYSYGMGINCYQLNKDKDYTLCIEILNSDYQLWHKSVGAINKTTSKGVSVAGFTVQKFSHQYTNSSGNTAYMYYIKIIVNFQKTVSGTYYSMNHYVDIPQTGTDLGTYPQNWTNSWMIAYGIFGKVSSIDPPKTYDYHTAFDIKPTEVVYNVDLDMNRKKILNIAPDCTKNNSAATVQMVKDLDTKLSPHTKNNAYREIFEEFHDLSDASNYKIIIGISGIMVSGILPNIYFPRMHTANIWEGGLRIKIPH